MISAAAVGSQPFHLVIPAAGTGSRFAAAIPKQYAEINKTPLIHHAIQACVHVGGCQSVTVALAADDRYWSGLDCGVEIHRVEGGAERSDSVLAALEDLAGRGVDVDALVLVHDAARPCVQADDVRALIVEAQSAAGAILAAPVADTLKKVSDGAVVATVDRVELWRALTPQAFRLGLLRQALAHCVEHGIVVTDDASAVEALGLQPRIVQGSSANIKVTLPEELAVAAQYLLHGKN